MYSSYPNLFILNMFIKTEYPGIKTKEGTANINLITVHGREDKVVYASKRDSTGINITTMSLNEIFILLKLT